MAVSREDGKSSSFAAAAPTTSRILRDLTQGRKVRALQDALRLAPTLSSWDPWLYLIKRSISHLQYCCCSGWLPLYFNQ